MSSSDSLHCGYPDPSWPLSSLSASTVYDCTILSCGVRRVVVFGMPVWNVKEAEVVIVAKAAETAKPAFHCANKNLDDSLCYLWITFVD